MLAASLILVLLPGLALVRPPWPTVPAISISFWVLSWFLVHGSGSGRQGFVRAALFFFASLVLIRLARPKLWGRPRRQAVYIGALCLAALVPWGRVEAPAAPDLSFDGAATRLLVWRDAIPRSFEPLVQGQPFITHAPGFQMLAADVVGPSGGAFHRGTFLVHRLGVALLALAVAYSLGRVLRTGPWATACAAATAALVFDLGGRFLPSTGATPLAAALALFSLALVARPSSRSAAVCAGFLGAGACAVLPAFAPLLLVGLVGVWGFSFLRSRTPWNRAALAAGMFLLASIPVVLHIDRRSWGAMVASAVDGALLPLTGLVAGLVVALLFEGAATKRAPWAAAGLMAIYIVIVVRFPRPAFDPAVTRAAAWVEAHVHPLETVCNTPGDSGRWLPALAGRAVTHPPAPRGGVWTGPSNRRPCFVSYDDGSSVVPQAFTVDVFRDGVVVVRARARPSSLP